MERDIIKRHNSVVSPQDEVWIIGDFIWYGPDRSHYYRNILDQLNGEKHLVFGNHDRGQGLWYVEMGFLSAHTSMIMEIDGHRLFLVHDPATGCVMDENTTIVCGHVHTVFSEIMERQPVINVGVDVRNFTPIRIEEVIKIANGLREK
jgi:calcineurin-like phosphoesterase family protein